MINLPLFVGNDANNRNPLLEGRPFIMRLQQLKMSAHARSNNPESVAIRRDDSFGKRRGTPIE